MSRIHSFWFPLNSNKFVYCSKQISRLIFALFTKHGSQFSPFRVRYRRKKICQQYWENYRTPCIQVVDHVLEVHHFLDGDCKWKLTWKDRKQKWKFGKMINTLDTSSRLQSKAFQSAQLSERVFSDWNAYQVHRFYPSLFHFLWFEPFSYSCVAIVLERFSKSCYWTEARGAARRATKSLMYRPCRVSLKQATIQHYRSKTETHIITQPIILLVDSSLCQSELGAKEKKTWPLIGTGKTSNRR